MARKQSMNLVMSIGFYGCFEHARKLLENGDQNCGYYFGKLASLITSTLPEIRFARFYGWAGVNLSMKTAEIRPKVYIGTTKRKVLILPTWYNTDLYPEETSLREVISKVVNFPCPKPLRLQEVDSRETYEMLLSRLGVGSHSIAWDDRFVELGIKAVEMLPLPQGFMFIHDPFCAFQNQAEDRIRKYSGRKLTIEFDMSPGSNNLTIHWVRVIEKDRGQGYRFAQDLSSLELPLFSVDYVILGSKQREILYKDYDWNDKYPFILAPQAVIRNKLEPLSEKLQKRYKQ